MLGLYVSDHPLQGLEHVLKASSDCTVGELLTDLERPDGSTVRICGLITGVQRRMSKKGDSWASVTLEDLEGGIEVMVFPGAYQLAVPVLIPDTIVVVKGRIRRKDDGIEINALEVTMPGDGQTAGPTPRCVVSLPVARCTADTIATFKQVLAAHPGTVRGAPATDRQRLDQGHAARRRPARRAVVLADRRSQGAAGSQLSVMKRSDPGRSRAMLADGCRCRLRVGVAGQSGRVGGAHRRQHRADRGRRPRPVRRHRGVRRRRRVVSLVWAWSPASALRDLGWWLTPVVIVADPGGGCHRLAGSASQSDRSVRWTRSIRRSATCCRPSWPSTASRHSWPGRSSVCSAWCCRPG